MMLFSGGTAVALIGGLAADRAQWGQRWSRNMMSDEQGLPDSFDPVRGRNIKWVARLGSETHWWGKHQAWIKCVDATKTGDITKTGELWSYPLERHSMCTPAIHDGNICLSAIPSAVLSLTDRRL